ncbi:MAG: hypothetical protein AAFO03_07685 [Bacteroidota bacterium]
MNPLSASLLLFSITLLCACGSDDDSAVPAGMECEPVELVLPTLDSWEFEIVNDSLPGSIRMFNETEGLILSDGRFYQTTDGLASFTEVVVALPEYLDAFDIITADTWLGAVHSVDEEGYFVSTILKTENAGLSWDTLLTENRDLLYVTKIHFINESKGFALKSLPFIDGGYTNKGISITIDGGHSWTKIEGLYDLGGRYRRGVQFINDTLGYILADSEVHKTTDGGLSFTGQGYSHTLVDFYVVDEHLIYGSGTWSETFKSTDGGQSWEQIFDFQSVVLRTVGNSSLILGKTENAICERENMQRYSYPTWTFIEEENSLYNLQEPTIEGHSWYIVKDFPEATMIHIDSGVINIKKR